MYNTNFPRRADLPSAQQLLRSTVLAAAIAAGLLMTTVLPAEYGIDPTGIGRVLGLTQMGEMKMALAANAQAEATPAIPASVPIVPSAPTLAPETPVAEAVAVSNHTVTIQLKPDEAAEIKLTMQKDHQVHYEWSVTGGAVNYDMHGDPHNAPKDFYHGYGKGRNKTADAGTLQAAFDGKHGWFWRNRSGAAVTIMLKTSGDYGMIERVL